MYRGTTAILAVPGFPRAILARIGFPLCLRGWGIRPLGASLVFSVPEAGSFRHFLLLRLLRSRPLTSASRLDSHRLSASPPSYHSAYQNRNLFTIVFSLNSIHTSSITTAALVIRRQNGHCGLSTQQSLLILQSGIHLLSPNLTS